jgi:hypothetical protein
MRNVSNKFVEIIKTHVLCSVTFLFCPKIVPFMKYCRKYGGAREAADDNMAHARHMLDN